MDICEHPVGVLSRDLVGISEEEESLADVTNIDETRKLP
jgi:hypothetical protein